MRNLTFSITAVLSLCAAASVFAAQAAAQQNAGPQGPPAQAAGQQGPRAPRAIAVEQLTPNVYWVRNIGSGGFIIGDTGVIVLDTGGSAATGKQILDAVAKVTPKPVTTIILSHGDGDHIGGLPAFPAGVKIIAQENAKKMIEAASSSTEATPGAVKLDAAHIPNRTVGSREDAHIDGVHLELLHWAPAHTSGDLVVYLPEQKLVFAGDAVVLDQHDLPLVHAEKGGTSKGWVETVQKMIALDATKYVVGHEGVVGKDVLEQQLKAAVAERQKVKELYDKGMSLADIEAAVGDPKPVQPGAPPHGGPNFPPYSEVVYNELKAGTY